MNGLNHNALTCSAVPIPPWERSLQTVEAQPYFNVSQASLVLEGIVFDRNNNLLFVDVATGRVFKLTPERQLSIVLKENSFGASGLAVHKDGRIFIASVGDMQRGSIRAIEPNGTREQMIVAPDTGFLVNDLVFDNQGGFYFTDSRGNSADPQGGVFYVSPNVGSIHAILPGLAVGNGIAIDPAGSQIWATEHAKNRLHRVRLSDATTVAPFGSVVTYQFTGPAPDGARVDSEGNVYVAISGQGRVMVFNRNGLPIGQIVLPDRDKGRNFSYYNISAHNVYYVKCNVVLNNVIFDSCLFPHQHYDRHSFHARECCAIRQNVRGDKSSMAFNNHFAHYSLFSYSKSQGNSFSHTCCLYCPAYLTAVAFSDRTRHGMPDEMLI